MSSTIIQRSMSALDVLLGEEGPQMRRILPPTNRLAPKAKCLKRNPTGQAVDTRVWLTGFSRLQGVRGQNQAVIRPQPLCFYCIHAFEVRGGRLDFPTNAPATAAQNSRLGQGQ